MDEARRVAPAARAGQKRILAIDHPLVYRLRHGRWRGATWLEEEAAAGAARERDVAIRFAELVDAGLFVSAAGDEVWVAIATRPADGALVADGLRELLFAIVCDAAGAEIWETRSDWPSGPLEWFEFARLGLREPISDPTPRRRDDSTSSTVAPEAEIDG